MHLAEHLVNYWVNLIDVSKKLGHDLSHNYISKQYSVPGPELTYFVLRCYTESFAGPMGMLSINSYWLSDDP